MCSGVLRGGMVPTDHPSIHPNGEVLTVRGEGWKWVPHSRPHSVCCLLCWAGQLKVCEASASIFCTTKTCNACRSIADCIHRSPYVRRRSAP
jgi:hypothetical protein